MATTAPGIAIDEYLHTSYEPDCDYVDGRVEERNLGELDHGTLQLALGAWFLRHASEWQIIAGVELRVRVSATRVRIPDVALISREAPREQVITHPPLAVIEVLSPEDRIGRYQERLADYRTMGIRNIWVVDPATRKGYNCSTTSWIEQSEFRIDDTPITLSLPTLFAELETK